MNGGHDASVTAWNCDDDDVTARMDGFVKCVTNCLGRNQIIGINVVIATYETVLRE